MLPDRSDAAGADDKGRVQGAGLLKFFETQVEFLRAGAVDRVVLQPEGIAHELLRGRGAGRRQQVLAEEGRYAVKDDAGARAASHGARKQVDIGLEELDLVSQGGGDIHPQQGVVRVELQGFTVKGDADGKTVERIGVARQRPDKQLGARPAEGSAPVEGEDVLSLDEEGSISELGFDASPGVAEAVVDGGGSDSVDKPDGVVASRGSRAHPEAEAGDDPRGVLRLEGLQVVLARGSLEFDDDAKLGDSKLVVDPRSHELGLVLDEMGSADSDVGQLENGRGKGERQAVAVNGLIVGRSDDHMDSVFSGIAGSVADLENVCRVEVLAEAPGKERQEAQQEAREDVVVILVVHVGLLLLLAAQVVPEGGVVTRLGKRRRRRRAVRYKQVEQQVDRI